MPSVGETARVTATPSPRDHVPSYELRHGETRVNFNVMGDIRPMDGEERGLYHAGRRYLRRLELLVERQSPVLLHSSLDKNGMVFAAELTNPDRYVQKRLIAPSGQLRIHRLMFCWQNHCFTQWVIENASDTMWQGDCTLWFDADFMPATDTSQSPGGNMGRRLPSVSRRNSVWLGHEDGDGARRHMRLDFTPTPPNSSSSVIWVAQQLQPAEVMTWNLTITCEPKVDAAPALTFDQALIAVTDESHSRLST